MTDADGTPAADLPAAVLRGLSRVRALEAQLADRVEVLRPSIEIEGATAALFAGVSALGARHGQALDDLAARRGARLDSSRTSAGPADAAEDTPGQLEGLAASVAGTVSAYDALYAAARLLYETAVCDLADVHAGEWAHEFQAINDVLPAAVHGVLVAEGLTCRCLCPACGIGACLCTRNSVLTIREHWSQPQLDRSEGIELRLRPRPGSQLADAGLDRSDRILAVDGNVVHANDELQRALRRHPIGERIAMRVIRAGVTADIGIARVSDLAS